MKFNSDLSKPFTETELDVLGLDREGDTLLAFDLNDMLANPNKPFAVLAIGPLPSIKAENLIYAAPFMYQRLGNLYRALEGLVEMCERLNAEAVKTYGEKDYVATAIERHATEMQDRVLEARRCAVVGPVTLAAEIQRHLLTRPKPKR